MQVVKAKHLMNMHPAAYKWIERSTSHGSSHGSSHKLQKFRKG